MALSVAAAGQRQTTPQTKLSPKAAAPIDITGYWVSVVTEDWRWRMVTPHKGDYTSVPLNPEGKRVADSWDLAKDDASGNQCKAFGIGGIMRQPGRLPFTWRDDTTLKLEFDAGTQVRELHFGGKAVIAGAKSWQGYSTAAWEGPLGKGPAAPRRTNTSNPDGRDDPRLLSGEEARK